jgi:mono/diheme cytochrome c family protein
MLRGFFGLVAIVILAMWTAGSAQRGCQDAYHSATRLRYFPIRDMRRSVALMPQKGYTRPPDSLSVPTVGRDFLTDNEDPAVDLASELAEKLTDTTVADDSSLARGERKFQKTCVPCHGAKLMGDGPVAALFMPPPDLLAQPTRERKDGYIYSDIRHGGIVMPSYGAQVTAAEAWDLIHYIRHLQKVSPR